MDTVLNLLLNVTPIELVAGLGYLFGHILLSKGLTSGWIIRIAGGIAWVIFLILNKNYIFMAVTTVIVLAMFYGLYKWRSGEFDKRSTLDIFFEVLAWIVAAVVISYFLISQNYSLNELLQTAIVILEISGTMLLARKLVLGWYAYIVMSTLVAVLIIFINPQPAPVLGLLELASIYFYIQGITNNRLRSELAV
ncbi:nicotinamide mononucleotide transporter [Candidatus Kaiserbacteria bacterium]|nr:nicotinamide mononucleotide transporter [Candidatus Kaiserbacteria bacterium]